MLSWAEATNPWVCIVHNHWSLSNWCCQLLSNVSFPFNHHKQAFAFTTNPAADMDVLEVVELLTKSTQTSFETTLTRYDQITQHTYPFLFLCIEICTTIESKQQTNSILETNYIFVFIKANDFQFFIWIKMSSFDNNLFEKETKLLK